MGKDEDDDPVRLYRAGLSIRAIAERTGSSRVSLTRLIRDAGLVVEPRGLGRRRYRLDLDESLAERLRELYVDRELSSDQVARVLGMNGRAVRYRLVLFGIPRRRRGSRRGSGQHLDATSVEQFYVQRGMTADETAALLNSSRRTVLRVAHDHDLPVRPGGTPSVKGDLDVRTLEALYDDASVREVLGRYGVPIVAMHGSTTARFPRPVDLTQELARALYGGCGVSLRDIELLTGVALPSVQRQFKRWQIERRPAGGISPFLRRWRNSQRAARRS